MNSASENSRAISELIRFATVSALCGAIDLAAGLCVLAIWQPPTYTAALIGWSGGVVSGYLLHLCWTFSGKDTPGSWGGFRLYMINCIVILLARWLLVAVAESVVLPAEVALIVAVIGSFVLNYLISKTFIFR